MFTVTAHVELDAVTRSLLEGILQFRLLRSSSLKLTDFSQSLNQMQSLKITNACKIALDGHSLGKHKL